MASYTIEIPEDLHREIQERRHRIDVADVCREALTRAVSGSFQFGHDIAEDLTRMFNADPHVQDA